MRDKLMKFDALWLRASFCVFLAGAALLGPASAQPVNGTVPELRDMAVVEKRGRLMAFVSLTGVFTPEVFEALHSGVITRFTYELVLMRARTLIYDVELARQTIVHQVKYDTLKKAYTFTFQNGTEEKIQRVTKSRKEMADWMREINGYVIAQSSELNANGRYYLQARANLNTVNFSFPFNYMLFFLAKKTPWFASATFGAGGM